MKLITKDIHLKIYLISLSLLAFGLPLSLFLMSIAQLILFINWLWEGNLIKKLKVFINNKPALIVSSLYLLHLIGLFYTSDFNYALKDLRLKFPLLLLPLIISTSKQLSKKEFYRILYYFIAGVLLGTFISLFVILFRDITDIRQSSLFISHIRFSLSICIAICILFQFIYDQKFFSSTYLILFSLLVIWLIIFLFIFESITGLIILSIIFLFYSIRTIFQTKNSALRYGLLSIVILLIGISYFSIKAAYNEVFLIHKTDFQSLPQFTKSGKIYEHDTLSRQTENGYYNKLFVCDTELRDTWNKRSKLNYDSLDLKKQLLKETLKRYLTSKGYKKDAEGVKMLSNEEVRAIESGIANCFYIYKPGIIVRLHQVLWEYKTFCETGFLNAHSVLQRYEFWKASKGIIKEHFWFGVGTGDINNSFRVQYEKMNTSLDMDHRWRSHNQYMSIFVVFGVVGFVWFIITLFYPIISTGKFRDFLYMSFFIIATLSMLTEDTIESQAGVTFFAFFNAFLLFYKGNDE